MCYEFDEMFRKAREIEEARRKKPADDRKDKSFAPARQAAPERGLKEKEPVPA